MSEKTTQGTPTQRRASSAQGREHIPLRTKKTKSELPSVQNRRLGDLSQPKGAPIVPSDMVWRIRGGVDRPMLILVLILLTIGSVMVFSAGSAYAIYKYDDSAYFIKRQLAFAAGGLVVLFVAGWFDYRWLRKVSPWFFMGCGVLLLATLAFGSSVGEAKRWLVIAGVRFQPSELMKTGLVLMLAWYFAKFRLMTLSRNGKTASMYGFVIPFCLVGAVCLLIALEHHFSCLIIMFLIGISVIWTAGAKKIWFGIGGGIFALVAAIAISFSDYAHTRVDVFLHPENYSEQDEVWQTLQGLNAIGSGGFLGVGLGNSRQKHMFVSEPQNDFIFTIVCEELGYLGALVIIVLFALLIWRGFVIAHRAPDTFSSLVVTGLTCKVAIQTVLNMMVVTNLLPNTGISLPFFSYGGSALIVLLGEMGIILNISRYTYEQHLE